MMDTASSDRQIRKIQLPGMGPGIVPAITAYVYGKCGTGPKAYIQAGLHGNEHAGMLVAHHLLCRLERLAAQGNIAGQVIVVPAINPVALSQYVFQEQIGRFDLSSGQNFNRGFPSLIEAVSATVADQLTNDPAENLKLIRSAGLAALDTRQELTFADQMKGQIMKMAFDADLVLDLHTDNQALLHMYTHPACQKKMAGLGDRMRVGLMLVGADQTAMAFDDTLNHFWAELAYRFDNYPIPHGSAAATIELRGRMDVDDRTAGDDAGHIIEFLVDQGIIKGPRKSLPDPMAYPVCPLSGMGLGLAPMAGIIVFRKEPGALVRKKEQIAEIIDLNASQPEQARQPVFSPVTGVLFSICLAKLVRAGQVCFKVAGENPVKDDKGPLLTP